MIALEDVTLSYPDGSRALDGLALAFPAGRTTALVGESGSGKSTTLRLINRLLEPSSGRVLVGGRDVAGMDPIALRRGIGYVVQGAGLIPHLTALENAALVPRLLGWDEERALGAARERLRAVRLDPAVYGGRYARQLSGGQQQRVGIARALAADPGVLLMDEPFGALDNLLREELQDEFLELLRPLGKTVVLVTHDMLEAARLADRVAVLRSGRLVQEGAPGDLLARPADDYVRRLLGRRRGDIEAQLRERP